MSCVSHAFASVHCCLVCTCWQRADLLALVGDFKCILVTFPCGVLGQVWHNSDLRNKCLDHQFSIVFTENLIKLHESLNNNLKRCSRGWSNVVEGRSTQSKKEGKDQELIQSSTTPDPGYQWENDNVTIGHYKREPRGQPFPSR